MESYSLYSDDSLHCTAGHKYDFRDTDIPRSFSNPTMVGYSVVHSMNVECIN